MCVCVWSYYVYIVKSGLFGLWSPNRLIDEYTLLNKYGMRFLCARNDMTSNVMYEPHMNIFRFFPGCFANNFLYVSKAEKIETNSQRQNKRITDNAAIFSTTKKKNGNSIPFFRFSFSISFGWVLGVLILFNYK